MTKHSVITADTESAARHISLSWMAVLALVCGLVTSGNSQADSSGLNDALFIPDNLDFYNPLKQADGHREYNPNIAEMDNVSLYRAADQYRSGEISASQRALNHQWMQQYHSGKGVDHGGKVLSKIFKMGFKTYWQQGKFDSRYLPDNKGDGKLTNDLDYRLRLTGNKLKLSFMYEF